MMLQIPQVLTKEAVRAMRARIDAVEWVDGNATSGPQAALAKRNMQLPEDSAAAREASGQVIEALSKNALFFSAALPLKVFPPLFNRYEGGQNFAAHIDNAVRLKRGSDLRVRTDLSATLFLTEADEYDGGALVVEDTYGIHEVKLDAGDLILYPASSLHHVTPVTKGARVSSFFWIQSMIREDAKRALLFNMDVTIQQLAQKLGQGEAQIVALTGAYHNLLRMWADT